MCVPPKCLPLRRPQHTRSNMVLQDLNRNVCAFCARAQFPFVCGVEFGNKLTIYYGFYIRMTFPSKKWFFFFCPPRRSFDFIWKYCTNKKTIEPCEFLVLAICVWCMCVRIEKEHKYKYEFYCLLHNLARDQLYYMILNIHFQFRFWRVFFFLYKIFRSQFFWKGIW